MSCFRKFFVLLLLMFFPVTLLSSCNEKDTVYELNFMVDGEIYETIETLGCEEIILPEDPEKDGYVFDGWYADEEYEEPFLKDSLIDVILICDVNIYSKWIPNANQIIFNGNGATSGEMSNQIINSGEIASLNENKFEKDLYDFVGWSTIQNGEVEYLDCDLYTMGTNSTYILYAVWEERIKFVSSVEDLKSIDNDLKNGIEYSKYVLKNDIAIEGEWNSIAIENCFDGCFDGCGYTITNKSINLNNGLFYCNEGVIKNLIIKNEISVIKSGEVRFGAVVYHNDGVVMNCKSTGSISIESTDSDTAVGGIVGKNTGTVNNCYTTADISITAPKTSRVGGIVGQNNNLVMNCFSTGDVYSRVKNTNVSIASNCVSGVVGLMVEGSTIKGVFSTGSINASLSMGTSYANNYIHSVVGEYLGSCIREKCCGHIDQILRGYSGTDAYCPINNDRDVNRVIMSNYTLNDYEYMGFSEFISEDDLTNNENNVWILSENLLPTLYFESSEL